jgi:hypothetical protein
MLSRLLKTLREAISTNTSDISTNTSAISTNASNISSNTGAIAAVRQVPTGGSSGQYLRNNGGGSYGWATISFPSSGMQIAASFKKNNTTNYTVPSGDFAIVDQAGWSTGASIRHACAGTNIRRAGTNNSQMQFDNNSMLTQNSGLGSVLITVISN